jgi:hypothetical protein
MSLIMTSVVVTGEDMPYRLLSEHAANYINIIIKFSGNRH